MRNAQPSEKVSVVIPTLWRSDCTVGLVECLLKWEHLEQLIIIDNAPQKRPKHDCWGACVMVEQSQNIFVNPAWNLGAQMATGKFLAICNDDILFNPDDLSPALFQLRRNEVIGLHKDSILNPSLIGTPEIESGFYLGFGWGCLMLMRRDTYTPIPRTIRVWYGDDWLVHSIRKKSSLKIKVQGMLSVSAGDKAFNSIKEEDKKQFDALIWNCSYRSLRVMSKWGFQTPLRLAIQRYNKVRG